MGHHEQASHELPRLGLATVYRALDQLWRSREVVLADMPGDERRYEGAGQAHHHPFRCSGCDQVYDLEICPVGIPGGTTLPGGYEVSGHELTLYGRCPASAVR